MLVSSYGAAIQTQASADPQNGNLKTVNEFLKSGAALAPINEGYEPYPAFMTGGRPYPVSPGAQVAMYNAASQSPMTLRTLFNRAFGSTAR